MIQTSSYRERLAPDPETAGSAGLRAPSLRAAPRLVRTRPRPAVRRVKGGLRALALRQRSGRCGLLLGWVGSSRAGLPVAPCQPLQFRISRCLLTCLCFWLKVCSRQKNKKKEKTLWPSSTKSTDLASVLEIQTFNGNLLYL